MRPLNLDRELANAAEGYMSATEKMLAAALEDLIKKCHTHGGPKGGKMDLSQHRAALEAYRVYRKAVGKVAA